MPDEATVLADDTGDASVVENQAITPVVANDKGDQMVPKSRLDQVIQQKKDMANALKGVADELIQDIPEAYRELVPAIDPAAQITWIRKAHKSGIFTPKALESLDTERPAGRKPINYNDMKPTQMISAGYKQ